MCLTTHSPNQFIFESNKGCQNVSHVLVNGKFKLKPYSLVDINWFLNPTTLIRNTIGPKRIRFQLIIIINIFYKFVHVCFLVILKSLLLQDLSHSKNKEAAKTTWNCILVLSVRLKLMGSYSVVSLQNCLILPLNVFNCNSVCLAKYKSFIFIFISTIKHYKAGAEVSTSPCLKITFTYEKWQGVGSVGFYLQYAPRIL